MKKYHQMFIKKTIALSLIFFVITGLTSCSSKSENKENEILTETKPVLDNSIILTASQFQSFDMKLGSLEMKSFSEVVKANGMFDVPPENHASVTSYFGGTVKELKLLPGEAVKKGQVLFVLENPTYIKIQQDYLEGKGQLSYLKSNYERQKNLVLDNVTSQKEYLKAESDYRVTKVRVASLGKELALMNIDVNSLSIDNITTTIKIKSPINGYITKVNISRGTFLDSSKTAITIVDTDHLHLELSVFEKDLSKVKVGQEITFSIQDGSNQKYKAYVHLVNKTIDDESRTVRIHGHLVDENIAGKFNPGMYVEAAIFTSSTQKLAISENAIVEVDEKYFVLMLTRKSNEAYFFVKKEVLKGETNNGFTEILNSKDFSHNATFLISGAFNLITE